MKIKLTIAALLISIISVAQEKLTPEEMFRWFPEGKYDAISYKNLELASKSPGFTSYLAFINRDTQSWAREVPAPFALKGKWLSIVEMHSVKYKISITDMSIFKKGMPPNTGGHVVEDVVYLVHSTGHTMQCLRYPLDLDLKKILLGQQGVSRAEQKPRNLPIYYYKSQKRDRHDKDLFFFITPENEVLTCDDLDYLTKMIAAGHGMLPNVTEDFPLPDALDLLFELGPDWKLSNSSSSARAVLQKMEKDEAASHMIDDMRQRIIDSHLYIRSLEFSKIPVRKNISYYDSQESAQRHYQAQLKYWHKENPDIIRNERGLFTHLNTTLSITKTMVIESLSFSDRYMAGYTEIGNKMKREKEAEVSQHKENTETGK